MHEPSEKSRPVWLLVNLIMQRFLSYTRCLYYCSNSLYIAGLSLPLQLLSMLNVSRLENEFLLGILYIGIYISNKQKIDLVKIIASNSWLTVPLPIMVAKAVISRQLGSTWLPMAANARELDILTTRFTERVRTTTVPKRLKFPKLKPSLIFVTKNPWWPHCLRIASSQSQLPSPTLFSATRMLGWMYSLTLGCNINIILLHSS